MIDENLILLYGLGLKDRNSIYLNKKEEWRLTMWEKLLRKIVLKIIKVALLNGYRQKVYGVSGMISVDEKQNIILADEFISRDGYDFRELTRDVEEMRKKLDALCDFLEVDYQTFPVIKKKSK